MPGTSTFQLEPKIDPAQPAVEPPQLPGLCRAFGLRLLGILLIAALPYIALAANLSKFNRAEVFFAECAREMLQTANLVTPLYHGHGFFDKPILIYWLILGCFKTFGVGHLTARLPSVLFALGSLALTGYAGARLFGARSGLLAAMALGSSFMFLSFANLCMSDMPLVFFDTAALTLLFAATKTTAQRNVCLWLAALSMGLGFLTKGPVGVVLPAVFFSTYLTITRQWRIIKAQHVLSCSAIIAASAAPWFLAAYRENGAEALTYFFLRENVQRFAGSTYDTHRPIWFMVSSLFGGFAPWSIVLPFAFAQTLAQRKTSGPQSRHVALYLWLWVATVTAFFSLSRGKIDYYVLPAYPAAAILVGAYICKLIDGKRQITEYAVGVIAAVLATAAAASFFLLPQIVGGSPWQWLLIPLSLAGCAFIAAAALWQKNYMRAFGALFLAICLAASGFALQICPTITVMQAVLTYKAQIAESSLNTRIGVFSSLENWIDELTFQTDREPLLVKNPAGADLFLHSPAPVLLLIPEDQFQQLPAATIAQVTVVGRRPFLAHSLNPGYILEHRGHLLDTPQLLLVANKFRQ